MLEQGAGRQYVEILRRETDRPGNWMPYLVVTSNELRNIGLVEMPRLS